MSLCLLRLDRVACSLGSLGCSELMQRRQGPQDRTVDGTLTRCYGFSSSGVACGERAYQARCSPVTKQLLFSAPGDPLLLCVVMMGAWERFQHSDGLACDWSQGTQFFLKKLAVMEGPGRLWPHGIAREV